MTDHKQFEAMLEALINDDQETAKDIFHNIVVAKSREIYEELLESDFDDKEEEKKDDEDDSDSDDDRADEAFGEEDDEEPADDAEDDEEPADDDTDVGGDATDDFVSDVSDEEDGEESDSDAGDVEDRVMDLEDALEELKAEFEQLMAGEEGDEQMGEPEMDGMDGMDAPAGDDMGDMGAGAEQDEFSKFMEYVDKVALPKHGDNGVQTKSTLGAKGSPTNNMGGTTANILRGDKEAGVEANKGNLKGNGVFKGGPAKEDSAGNINVPGAKKATKLSNVPAGHGAEKKGKGEQAENKKSIVGSR